MLGTMWCRAVSAFAGFVALAVLVAGCGGEADYDVPSISAKELRPCGGLPKPAGFRCGSIQVPFEREDASLGEAKVGFAVRERDEPDEPSRGAIFARWPSADAASESERCRTAPRRWRTTSMTCARRSDTTR
jgi:hypothetical protein